MYSTMIFLHDLNNVKQFAAITAKYDKLKINLISDVYTIDAHSLIGIISLDITDPMTLELPDEEPSEEFLADIRPGEGEMPDDAAIIALVDEAHRVLD